MKLHLTQDEGHNLITAYDNGKVAINHQPYTQSLIVMPTQLIADWHIARFDALTEQHLSQIAALKPELILLGTGQQHRFIHPRLLAELVQQHIPLECMTTAAACRTYNILMAEGRNVAAALIIEA